VKFGATTIEVATFRRQVDPAELTPEIDVATAGPADVVPPDESLPSDPDERLPRAGGRRRADHLIHRDNTYGTPEEDAFRRDFTINALFYDIGTFAIIDYVGGLRDLESRIIRCIGDPEVRFLEDPVRMLRAVVLAARLQFTIDEPILDAIAALRHEIGNSAPARLLEEYYKILRSGHAEGALRQLRATGLLKAITPELAGAPDALWRSVAALDAYRARFGAAPETLSNAILAGSLLVPVGLAGRRQRFAADPLERRVDLGMLPIPRRDVERLHQVLSLQARLLDTQAPHRAQRGLLHRPALDEALTWLEIHGDRPEVVAHWRDLQAQSAHHAPAAPEPGNELPFRRPRRRRRRRRRAPFIAGHE
jgi:poly(A) polymerase